jgi:hypothetical protein
MSHLVDLLRTPTGTKPPTKWELQAADRIEVLEAALREIVQWTEDYRFYAPAVGKIARAALDKDAGQ